MAQDDTVACVAVPASGAAQKSCTWLCHVWLWLRLEACTPAQLHAEPVSGVRPFALAVVRMQPLCRCVGAMCCIGRSSQGGLVGPAAQ
jgi:hypothetical protein